MIKIEGTNFWYRGQIFEADARLDEFLQQKTTLDDALENINTLLTTFNPPPSNHVLRLAKAFLN
jgi:hypothetical protein